MLAMSVVVAPVIVHHSAEYGGLAAKCTLAGGPDGHK
jgi:hypothetical protein